MFSFSTFDFGPLKKFLISKYGEKEFLSIWAKICVSAGFSTTDTVHANFVCDEILKRFGEKAVRELRANLVLTSDFSKSKK
jgi:hypothetical protein